MKKLISLFIAVTMLSASVVSAASCLDDDGLVASLPDKTEMETRIPVVTISEPEFLDTYDKIYAASNTSFAKQTAKDEETLNTYDVYKYTWTVTNVGYLVHGCADDWETEKGLTVSNLAFGFNLDPALVKKFYFAGNANMNANTSSLGKSLDDDLWTGHEYGFAEHYPICDATMIGNCEAVEEENPEFTYTVLVALPEDTEVTVDEYYTTVFYYWNNGGNDYKAYSNKNATLPTKAIKFAKPSTDDGTFKFTVNETEATATAPAAGAAYTADNGKKGFVWGNCAMKNADVDNVDYYAYFGIGNDFSAGRKTLLKLSDVVEADKANIVFDAVMVTDKADVTMYVGE